MPHTETDAMGEIFFALCKSVESPVSLACWLLYKYGEHEQLARKKVQPQHYCTAASFRDDYLVTSYLSKWEGLETGIDRREVALDGFAAAELKCKQTNERLRAALRGFSNPRYEPVLTLAVVKIGAVLQEFSWVRALEKCKWGKGATSTLKGEAANLVRKYDPVKGRISVTRGALSLGKAVIESDPHWLRTLLKSDVCGPTSLLPQNFEIVEGNAVTTVPKDATKDRTIAAEPTLNIFLQLGVGLELRRLLRKRCGIDLNDQTQNQRGALIGSITGEYATLDMKSASDTVSKELVYQLIPPHVSVLLEALRSPKGRVDNGNWFEYEKFSSMGNGFTFELETLIFWALAVASLQHLGLGGRVLVYGDDVVLPGAAASFYREVLDYCGFEVNPSKSYESGHFRESCGSHYWAGRDVTPVFQKESFFKDGEICLPEAYRLTNRLLRCAYDRGGASYLDSRVRGAWLAARRSLGLERGQVKHVQPLGSEGDDGLLLFGEELLDHVCSSRTLSPEQWQAMIKSFVRRRRWMEPLVVSEAGHGMVKYPVLSWRPAKLSVSDNQQGALLAYWLRQSHLHHFVERRLDEDPGSTPFAGRIPVRRRGIYVSRRRLYPIGTTNVAWL